MISQVDAVCLLVDSLSISREFYENKLGLTVKSTDTGFVEYKLGETPIALFEKKFATSMFPSKYMTHAGGLVLALKVDSVEKQCQKLKSLGVEIFEGPKEVPWGQTVAYLHDPNGYIIEITS